MNDAKPNAELAYRVLDRIDAQPELWRQAWYFTRTECGTAACFAGWACLLSGEEPDYDYADEEEHAETCYTRSDRDAHGLATELRRINPDSAALLFSGANSRHGLQLLVEEFFGPRPN